MVERFDLTLDGPFCSVVEKPEGRFMLHADHEAIVQRVTDDLTEQPEDRQAALEIADRLRAEAGISGTSPVTVELLNDAADLLAISALSPCNELAFADHVRAALRDQWEKAVLSDDAVARAAAAAYVSVGPSQLADMKAALQAALAQIDQETTDD